MAHKKESSKAVHKEMVMNRNMMLVAIPHSALRLCSFQLCYHTVHLIEGSCSGTRTVI